MLLQDAAQTSKSIECHATCLLNEPARVGMDAHSKLHDSQRLGEGVWNKSDDIQVAAEHSECPIRSCASRYVSQYGEVQQP